MFWDPYVLKEGSKTHLFFGSLFCKSPAGYQLFWDPQQPKACDLKEVIFAIGYGFKAHPQDPGYKFRSSPVLAPAAPGQWDDHYIETPAVIRVEQDTYLFYSAWNQRQWKRYQIGVARLTSPTGPLEQTLLQTDRPFQRLQPDPLLPYSGQLQRFDRENTQEPSVVYRDGRFELFYLGIQARNKQSQQPLGNGPLDDSAEFESLSLGLACFDRQLQHQPCPQQLDQQPLLQTTFKQGQAQGAMVNIPEVRWSEALQRYLLFYTDFATGTGPQFQGNQIAWRHSVDLKNWSAAQMALAPGADPEANWGLASPSFQLQGRQLELYYTGWGLHQPTQPQPGACFQERFRTPLDPQHQRCISASLGYAQAQLQGPLPAPASNADGQPGPQPQHL